MSNQEIYDKRFELVDFYMSQASDFHKQGKYEDATNSCAKAWEVMLDASFPLNSVSVDHHRILILSNWGNSFFEQNLWTSARDKYLRALEILNSNHTLPRSINSVKAKLQSNLGVTLFVEGELEQASLAYEAAWNILNLEVFEVYELDGLRVINLLRWTALMKQQRDFNNAIEKFGILWRVLQRMKLCFDTQHAVHALAEWGHCYKAIHEYFKAGEKYSEALGVLENIRPDQVDSRIQRAEILEEWAEALELIGNVSEASKKYSSASELMANIEISNSRILKQKIWLAIRLGVLQYRLHSFHRSNDIYDNALSFFDHPLALQIDDNLKGKLLMNRANTQCMLGLLDLADQNYFEAWSIFCDDSKKHPGVAIDVFKLLSNWAITLRRLNRADDSLSKYEAAWNILDQMSGQIDEILILRVQLLMNWANAIKIYNQASLKYIDAWHIYSTHLRAVRHIDELVVALVLNWQHLFPQMENRQAWAREVSLELSRRLSEQNLAAPPHWLGELYRRFAQFHLRWMQHSLEDGHPEHLVDILSRVSSWRMATALLDELETMVPAPVADDAARALLHYQRMRLEVRRLQQRLQERENAAGRGGTDFSGLRGFGLVEREHPPEVQARLNAELDALRAEYDHAYTQMQLAQVEAAKVSGYEALSVDRHALDSQKLLGQLKTEQAVLVVFDQQTPGESPDEFQQLSGALLLKDGQVHWHPIDDMAQGSAFLHEFEDLVSVKRGGLRGSGADGAALNVETPFYGDFRRGDVAAADEKPASEPLVYQGQTITHLNLWESLGDWVEDTLWKPLEQKGLLDGVQELVMVTQGQKAHAIPCQMNAPVASTAIRRYPGLMFYAMEAGLMSRAACSDEPTLGIAHYEGAERSLPFARIEADILGQIWTQSGRTAVQDFDVLKPQQSAGSVHIAGHGSHAPDTKEQAVISGLAVGKDTYWGLSQLMGSPSRPKEVYLSCCVAGRTTDLAGEQYGVTSAFLQHGARQVVGTTVSLNDLWGEKWPGKFGQLG